MIEPCRVSIVIPVYNGAAYLAESVQSALAQSIEDVEALVVDDGSTDASAEIAAAIAAADPRVELLRHPDGANRGVSRSRELGVSRARAPYVAFLDADDLFGPDKLERQLAAFEAHPQCVLCHTAVSAFSSSDTETAAWFEEYFSRPGDEPHAYTFFDRVETLRQNPVCNSTALVRTDVLRRIRFGLPQLFQFEDFLLWTLLSTAGPFLFLPDKLVRYRVHPASASARVKENPLVGLYSQVEYVLSLIALSRDERLLGLGQRALHDVLRELMCCYEGRERPALKHGDVLEFDLARVIELERQVRDVRQENATLSEAVARLEQENAALSETLSRLRNHVLLGPVLRCRRRLLDWTHSRNADA